ncbi:MAG: mucoidy inhibitor MuiA family protein [Bacteroidia bacterium]|nr:MAG: mucoidy inhibitor MuiA family protein [Bacteroidia bacterium]
MRSIFLSLSMTAIWMLSGSFAMAEDLNIRRATVYLDGAEVTAEAELNLRQGRNEITFKNLSPFMDPASLQIAGEGFRVLSISRGMDTVLDDKAYLDSLRMLTDQIQALEKRIREAESALRVLSREEAVLTANQKLTGEGGVSAGELQQALEFFFARLQTIENNRLKLTEKNRSLREEIQELEKKKAALIKPKEEVYSTVHLILQADAAGKIPVEIRYMVSEAGWFPTYDIFADGDQLEISYNANIRQQSGEDWNAVNLIISSASPVRSQVLPRLQPYYLQFGRPAPTPVPGDLPRAYDMGIRQVSGQVLDAFDQLPLPGVSIIVSGTSVGTVTDANGRYHLHLPSEARMLEYRFIGMKTRHEPIRSSVMNVVMEPDMVALQEIIVVGYGVKEDAARLAARPESRPPRPQAPPSISLGYQTSFAYGIDIPYDIPSSEEPVQAEIKRLIIPAEMRYQAAPKLEEAAFLTARVADWEQYNLLDGEANLYIDNQYMGRNVLETRTIDDTLAISLGRDENIIINRQRQREYEQRRRWTNRVREERMWHIAVRNNKSEQIVMELFDQVPVSRTADIRVEVINKSGATINEETGILQWILEIQPGETAEVIIHYSVEYPRDRYLIIE